MENQETQKQTWYDKISDGFDTLMRKFDMPEDMQIEIRNFVFGVAREQYKVGNRSGIMWLRKKIREEANGTAVAEGASAA